MSVDVFLTIIFYRTYFIQIFFLVFLQKNVNKLNLHLAKVIYLYLVDLIERLMYNILLYTNMYPERTIVTKTIDRSSILL